MLRPVARSLEVDFARRLVNPARYDTEAIRSHAPDCGLNRASQTYAVTVTDKCTRQPIQLFLHESICNESLHEPS